MLVWSGWVLLAAALGGLVVIGLANASPGWARAWWPGAVHGLTGILGFVLLIAGLGGPARGVARGAGSFGTVAAYMVGAGLVLASGLIWARWRRRPPSMLLVGVHATMGVGGLVMLAAYLA